MEKWVIVNVGTDRAYGKNSYTNNVYETERGAKGACTKLNNAYRSATPKDMAIDPQWKVIPYQEYINRPVKMVERINLISGLPYMEAENTPNFCSPASEAYWSM